MIDAEYKIEFRPFCFEDALKLCNNPIDPHAKAGRTTIIKTAVQNIEAGPCYTGIIHHEGHKTLLGAAGIRLKPNGKGNMWGLFSPEFAKYKKTALRGFRYMLETIAKEYNIKKLRSESLIGFDASQTLLIHLGFKYMRKMINQKYYFFAKEI